MDDERNQHGYWAVIPPEVRYDTKLSAGTKLLYGEISALTDKFGYCWASNDYFERLYGLSERTIIRMIQSLDHAGYIVVADGQTTRRRIYAGINPLKRATEDGVIEIRTTDKNVRRVRATDKNVTATDKNVTATDKNVSAIYNDTEEQEKKTTPKAPKGAGAEIWDKPAWDRFWAVYPRKVDKAKALRAWNKLKADRKLMQIMSAALKTQRASEEWRRDNGRAIPYPSTWLNNRRWEDEVPAQPRGAAPADRAAGEEAIEWV